jgi:hypothetical protein
MRLTVIKKREYPFSTWDCVDETGAEYDRVDLINGSDLKAEDVLPGMVIECCKLLPYISLAVGQKIVEQPK